MFGHIMRGILIGSVLVVFCGAAWAASVDYFGYDDFGGTWSDAEKSPSNGEDDLMCWAAAAGNILAWTGWGAPVSDDTDEIFAYFQDHWTDVGGMMEYGWDWWFDGTNPSQGWTGWSWVDVPGGGFWDPPYSLTDYFKREWQDSLAMSAIYTDLHAGYGVTLGVYGPGGHAITCWGIRYDDVSGDYLGVWVTDSDDNKGQENPPDMLRYYNVVENDGKWYLQSFYSSNAWYIGEVQSLLMSPIPEPATFVLMAVSALGMFGVIRRRR